VTRVVRIRRRGTTKTGGASTGTEATDGHVMNTATATAQGETIGTVNAGGIGRGVQRGESAKTATGTDEKSEPRVRLGREGVVEDTGDGMLTMSMLGVNWARMTKVNLTTRN
jgi:hypothetical protein